MSSCPLSVHNIKFRVFKTLLDASIPLKMEQSLFFLKPSGQRSHVFLGICWSHSLTLRVTTLHFLITTGINVPFTFHIFSSSSLTLGISRCSHVNSPRCSDCLGLLRPSLRPSVPSRPALLSVRLHYSVCLSLFRCVSYLNHETSSPYLAQISLYTVSVMAFHVHPSSWDSARMFWIVSELSFGMVDPGLYRSWT